MFIHNKNTPVIDKADLWMHETSNIITRIEILLCLIYLIVWIRMSSEE